MLSQFDKRRLHPLNQDPRFQHILVEDACGTTLRMLGPSLEDHDNFVLYANVPLGLSAAALVAREVAFFKSQGRRFEWKWFAHDDAPNLPEALTSQGFCAQDKEVVLFWESSMALPLASPKALISNEVEIKEIRTSQELAAVTAVQTAVWGEGFDWLEESLAHELQTQPDSIDIWCAFVKGAPVSTGWIRYESDSWATLHGGSTIEAYRNQGIFKTLVHQRMIRARARGIKVVLVEAAPMSAPILLRFGFTSLTESIPFLLPSEEV